MKNAIAWPVLTTACIVIGAASLRALAQEDPDMVIAVCIGADKVLRLSAHTDQCRGGELRYLFEPVKPDADEPKTIDQTTPVQPKFPSEARVAALEDQVQQLQRELLKMRELSAQPPGGGPAVSQPGANQPGASQPGIAQPGAPASAGTTPTPPGAAAPTGPIRNATFMEPFLVVDRKGKPLAFIGTTAGHRTFAMLNEKGTATAVMIADEDGGAFAALGGSEGDEEEADAEGEEGGGSAHIGISALGGRPQLIVKRDGIMRANLGTNGETPNMSLRFLGEDEQVVAGIGESKAGTGLVQIADTEGRVRANMMMRSDGKPAMGVLGADGIPLATLTLGIANAGYFMLTNSSGEPMVDAGSRDNRFGVVRTGPASFTTAAGLGLPGSYILGKAN